MDNRTKFSIIKKLKQEKMFDCFIPDFISITSATFDSTQESFIAKSPCIMRSSLKNEASGISLNAGKSLSIKDICNRSDFQNAYNKISAQDGVEEIILQKQQSYNEHVTVLLDDDFLYGSFTMSGKDDFFVLSSITQMGNFPNTKLLLPFLECLRERFKQGKWLFELGISNDHIFLFQAVLIPESLVNSIFTDDLLCKIIKSKGEHLFAPTLWKLIKCEWKAFLFRRQKHFNSDISQAFSNWYYLFHYFYLFCKKNHRHGHDRDFVEFLKTAYQKDGNFQSEIIKRHLEIASQIRKNESQPHIPTSFSKISNEIYFLGKGKHEGIIDRDVLLLEELLPDVIYRVPREKIIFTPCNQILSHGILAAAERKINILANMEKELFSSIASTDRFCIDFEKNSFVIQS